MDWARTAVEEFNTRFRLKAQYVAATRFDLALTHLGRGELDAVSEYLAPVLRAATPSTAPCR